MCLAQGPQGPQPSDAGEARTRRLRSQVKHSTTEPLRVVLPPVYSRSQDCKKLGTRPEYILIRVHWVCLQIIP